MTQRMTDARLGIHQRWVAQWSESDQREVLAELDRARTSETERAETIRALGEALWSSMENGHRRDCPHSLRRYKAVAVPCSEECERDRAALRLAGVLT